MHQVQRDFEELPPDAAEKLRASLLSLLIHFATGATAVSTQLCLAIAAMAAHVPAQQWGQGGVVMWLAQNLGQQSQDIALPCMLELLTIIPEASLITMIHGACALQMPKPIAHARWVTCGAPTENSTVYSKYITMGSQVICSQWHACLTLQHTTLHHCTCVPAPRFKENGRSSTRPLLQLSVPCRPGSSNVFTEFINTHE